MQSTLNLCEPKTEGQPIVTITEKSKEGEMQSSRYTEGKLTTMRQREKLSTDTGGGSGDNNKVQGGNNDLSRA